MPTQKPQNVTEQAGPQPWVVASITAAAVLILVYFVSAKLPATAVLDTETRVAAAEETLEKTGETLEKTGEALKTIQEGLAESVRRDELLARSDGELASYLNGIQSQLAEIEDRLAESHTPEMIDGLLALKQKLEQLTGQARDGQSYPIHPYGPPKNCPGIGACKLLADQVNMLDRRIDLQEGAAKEAVRLTNARLSEWIVKHNKLVTHHDNLKARVDAMYGYGRRY